MKYIKFYEAGINWLHHKLSKRQFLIFSSMLIGLSAGLAAVILKSIVHYIHDAITHDYHFQYQYYIYLLFPLVGILLCVFFVHRFLHGKLGKPPETVAPDESMTSVMKKFDETGAWNFPVTDNGQYVGFISKSSIFSKYRKVLIKSSIN